MLGRCSKRMSNFALALLHDQPILLSAISVGALVHAAFTSPRKVWSIVVRIPIKTIRLNWVRAISVALVLWATAISAATLSWDAVSAPDLAGYRVYQCSQTPCEELSGTATLLATLGMVTSFNIGAPTGTQYYMVTAYDLENNESDPSNVVTYIPSPPPTATVSLTVLGSPDRGEPWAVQATTNASGTVSVQFWVNGSLGFVANSGPYCSFGNNGTSCSRALYPFGDYTVEARVLSNGVEVARQAIVVTTAAATVGLTVLGSPDRGEPWAVQATTNASGTVSVQFWVNGSLGLVASSGPYCSFGNNGTSCTRVLYPFGDYTVEARVLSNGVEVARRAIAVTAAPNTNPIAATVSLTVLGSPDRGEPWAVQATTNASGTVSVQFWINGRLKRTESNGLYCSFNDNGGSCRRVLKSFGFYTVEARVLSNGVEVARQAIVVTAASTVNLAAATVGLTVLGSPDRGEPWAVQATTNASGTVSVQFWVNGRLEHTESSSPYCSFNDSSASCSRVLKSSGFYTVEARVLSNGVEVARQTIVVRAAT